MLIRDRYSSPTGFKEERSSLTWWWWLLYFWACLWGIWLLRRYLSWCYILLEHLESLVGLEATKIMGDLDRAMGRLVCIEFLIAWYFLVSFVIGQDWLPKLLSLFGNFITQGLLWIWIRDCSMIWWKRWFRVLQQAILCRGSHLHRVWSRHYRP